MSSGIPGKVPEPTLAEFKPVIEKALASEFGAMTGRRIIMADSGHVPAWRVRLAIRNFLVKQADLKKRLKEKTRRRQRDIGRDKYKEIVDGRIG